VNKVGGLHVVLGFAVLVDVSLVYAINTQKMNVMKAMGCGIILLADVVVNLNHNCYRIL